MDQVCQRCLKHADTNDIRVGNKTLAYHLFIYIAYMGGSGLNYNSECIRLAGRLISPLLIVRISMSQQQELCKCVNVKLSM